MKKITKIEYQKNNKNRVNIYLDSNYEFGLDLDVVLEYGLKKGMDLEEGFIDEVLLSDSRKKAYSYALSVLARRPVSEKQLALKMKNKDYEHEIILFVIDKLKRNKYIDDEDYSERFINDKVNYSNFGKLKIKSALYSKGVERQIIEEKIGMIEDEDEARKAYDLAKKKLKTLDTKDSGKIKMKLVSFLINKGFEYSTVKGVITRIFGGEDLDGLDYYDD